MPFSPKPFGRGMIDPEAPGQNGDRAGDMDDGDGLGQLNFRFHGVYNADEGENTAQNAHARTHVCHEALGVAAVLLFEAAGIEHHAVEQLRCRAQPDGGVDAQTAEQEEREHQNQIQVQKTHGDHPFPAQYRFAWAHYSGKTGR